MFSGLRHFFARHEPSCGHWLVGLKSAGGGVMGIGFVGALATVTGWPFLAAPFGASAVLLFGHPVSPLAQPANVLGGYALAIAVGLLLALAFPGAWWAAALGVGLAILLMLAARVSHPPAGAVPVLLVASQGQSLLLSAAMALGSLLLVLLAALYHRLPPRHDYPRRPV